MTALHFSIAALPFSVYLLLLWWLNLRRCPFVTTAGRDIAILAVVISGLLIIGPMELFFPENAVSRFGPYVWVMLLAFYGLTVSLVAMLIRPGLVIYNAREDQIRSVLAEVLGQMDRPQWSGENVRLPNVKIHFQVESHPWLQVIQLVSCGREQNLVGWRRMELDLKKAMGSVPGRSNLQGLLFVLTALALNLVSVVWMIQQPAEVLADLQQMLRL